MTPKLNQELEEALIRSHGEPIEVESERNQKIYVLVGRDQYQQSLVSAPDLDKLRQAIIARRDESRELNEDWQHADREVWDTSSNQR